MLLKTQQLLRVPHDHRKNYTENFITARRQWLSQQTGVKFQHAAHYSFDPEEVKGNIENLVGVAQIPVGIVGPLEINGKFAKGTFFVPFATTEGAIVTTYQRGAIAITKSGGTKTILHKDENRLDPVFLLRDASEGKDFIQWVRENFPRIKAEAEETTRHGKLLRITPYLIGRRTVLDFAYETADAMGANMINVATERACQFICRETAAERFLLRSNFSSEKKSSLTQLLTGIGKEIVADVTLPRKIVAKYLKSSPEEISSSWHSWALSSFTTGMVGINAHYANGLAAIYIACGQDAAHVTNGSIGITMFEVTNTGDLYAAVRLPNLLVGTVGGGTALPTQREYLQSLGCYGAGKSRRFAEIVAATLLAGEIGICAGIVSEEFLQPHKEARSYTRAKAFQEQNPA